MPALCDPPSEFVDQEYSGTDDHVSHPQRLTIERVRDAYHALECRPSDIQLLETCGDDIVSASPPWVVAAYETGLPIYWLERKLADGRDELGYNWLGMRLGLDPDYLRGHTDGYFGQLPCEDFAAYRVGWRDGSAAYRDLFTVQTGGKQ